MEMGFGVVYEHWSGGVVWQHELVDVHNVDYNAVLEIAIDKAQAGHEVHILPTLISNHPLRKTVFIDAKERKCPDLKIDGRYTEIKTPAGRLHKQNLSQSIKKAYGQANDIIIRLHSCVSLKDLSEVSKGRFITHRNLRIIEFKMEGKYVRFERSDFL